MSKLHALDAANMEDLRIMPTFDEEDRPLEKPTGQAGHSRSNSRANSRSPTRRSASARNRGTSPIRPTDEPDELPALLRTQAPDSTASPEEFSLYQLEFRRYSLAMGAKVDANRLAYFAMKNHATQLADDLIATRHQVHEHKVRSDKMHAAIRALQAQLREANIVPIGMEEFLLTQDDFTV